MLNCECIPETKSLGIDSRFLSSWLFELRMDRSRTKSQTLQTLSSGFTESKEEQLASLALVGSWHYSRYFSFSDFWKIHLMYFSFSDLCVLLNVVSFHGQCFSPVLRLSSGGQILRYTTADVGDHWTSFQQMGISARCSRAYSRAITSYPGVRIAMLSCCSVWVTSRTACSVNICPVPAWPGVPCPAIHADSDVLMIALCWHN